MRIVSVGCLIVLMLASDASAQVAKLYPVDEAAQDSSLMLFRLRLIEALVERDTAFVYAHLAPEVKVSFGPGNGLASFKAMWHLDNPESPFWLTMAGVIGAGGLYYSSSDDKASFIAAYYFSAFPNEYDAFEYAVVVGERVNVRSAPSTEDEVLTRLSYDIVRILSLVFSNDWMPIELADGTKGFIASRYVKSPIGYRAGFEKIDGRWRIRLFLAGD